MANSLWSRSGLHQNSRSRNPQPLGNSSAQRPWSGSCAHVTLRRTRSYYFFLRFLVGLPLRLVLAILRSSCLLIDLYIPRESPSSDEGERSPRLAASAAPAAICCFFDFAGIQKYFAYQMRNGLLQVAALRQKK